ncbi:cyclin-related protein, putative [Babesia caballi]|uniref:Cyclin-related protein, putative n=1 Tax=Babesia caballi TaxID=5871 RepID=A0AAV4LL07_BABCB|nr:cyclin-related protein, putative [Babesia caballi]
MLSEQEIGGSDRLKAVVKGPVEPGTLTRNATIEHPGVVRNIGDCPLTLRRSVGEWSIHESHKNGYFNKDSHQFHEEPDNCASTPRHHIFSARSHADANTGLETVHNRKGLYGDLSYPDSTDLRERRTISLGDVSEGIDFETLLYGPLHDQSLKQQHQQSVSTTDSCRFEQPRPVWHFFNAITSDDVQCEAEDWGIDRSIYTRYARSGFFADCHIADSMHHGEYLNHTDFEDFAECRIPLIVCIISTSRETRPNEVQRGIVPLAVNLLDRYIVKHKNSMSRLISIACAHTDGTSSEGSSKQASLASSINAADLTSLDSSIAKGLKNKSNNDNIIKLRFKFSSDDKFGLNKTAMEHPFHANAQCVDTDSCRDDNSDYGETDCNAAFRSGSKLDLIYNFVAAACFFIADRYNGLSNTSVKALLYKWEAICHTFTNTLDAAKYIRENRATALSIIMSFMFDIYFVLEYKLTTPFPCHMVQDLILSTTDFRCSQNPGEYNIYQKSAAIMARIAYVDDTFHRFPPSIITLAIYSVVRRLAVRNEFVDDENAWLLVDDSDAEIRRCSDLLVNTMMQYVNTDILDALTQPVYMKHQNDELFGLIFDDLCELDIGELRSVASTLVALC